MSVTTAKRSRAGKGSSTIHQLKVTLQRSRPPIWRRLLVPSDVTLAQLHDILQTAMGWHDCHLHEFRVGETVYGDQSVLEEFDVENERNARLARVAPHPKARLRYQYDFGDSWDHLIVVEAILPRDPEVTYPICVTGKRACPPEDCGGVWGYANLLDSLKDPLHPEHADMMEWIGGSFDPEAFDLKTTNLLLANPRQWG